MPRTTLAPRDQAEAIALFRAEIVGSVADQKILETLWAHGAT